MSEANHNLSIENPITSTNTENNSFLQCETIVECNQEKEINLHKFAHKLREHNRKLLKKVFQLEQEVIESNQSLEEQKKISQNHYLCVAKQADKINQYQEEIAELVEQLTAYKQKNQSQQVMVEKLTQKLESSQQKAEKLEKDYTELVTINNNKTKELIEKKQQIHELNLRFQRQQQYLLEQKNTHQEKIAIQPIKAWSASSIETKTETATPLAAEINSPNTPDWPAPAIATKTTQSKSLAGVKLPQFPRRAEAE